MDGFERRKEQKKDSIRRAAIELFRTYGFEKVSLVDIARKAHVSHVTIYNHFGGKEDLVRDIIETAIAEVVEASREVIDSDIPFLEKLERIIAYKMDTAGQYHGELMRTAVQDNPAMREFIESLWAREVDDLVRKLIAEGKELGYINRELSQEAILYYFDIIKNGAFASAGLLDTIKVDARLAHDLNCLFLYGLVDRKL